MLFYDLKFLTGNFKKKDKEAIKDIQGIEVVEDVISVKVDEETGLSSNEDIEPSVDPSPDIESEVPPDEVLSSEPPSLLF